MVDKNDGSVGLYARRPFCRQEQEISAHLEVRPPERKFFSAHKDVRHPERNFSAHWRARPLPSRNFGKSANRHVGKSGCRQKIFGSPEVRPPEQRSFRFTGGRGSCRAVISAGRQVGRSASRDVGRKFSAHQMFALQNGKILRLTGGRGSCRAEKIWRVVLPHDRKISAHLEVRSPEQKFSAHQRFALQKEIFRTLLEGEAPAEPKKSGGSCSCTTEKFRLTRMFALQNGEILRLTWKFALQNRIFSAHQRFALRNGKGCHPFTIPTRRFRLERANLLVLKPNHVAQDCGGHIPI